MESKTTGRDTAALNVSVGTAARWLELSTRSIHRLIESGEITAVKIGGSTRIPVSVLRAKGLDVEGANNS